MEYYQYWVQGLNFPILTQQKSPLDSVASYRV